MSSVKPVLARLLRAYAVWGALLVCVGLPGALYRIGTVRVRPVRLDSLPRADGSVTGTVVADGRRGRFGEVSIAGGPWLPAGGVAAARTLGDLPAGTTVAYREVRDGDEPGIMTGVVAERPAQRSEAIATATLALLAVVLAASGAGIAVAGVSSQALLAGAALAGLGHFAGARFLEASASLVLDPATRGALVLGWVTFPRHLAFLALVGFLALFPSDLTARRLCRLLLAVVASIALVQAVLVPLIQVDGPLDGLAVPAQARIVAGTRQLTALLFGVGALGALGLIAMQARAFRREPIDLATRRRASVVGAGLLAGFGPPLVLALAQIASKGLGGRPLLAPTAMVLSLLPVLLVPPALAYAMLSPRVLSVGILVRKALLLGFAQGTVRIICLAPLAALGLLFYARREAPIGEVFADHLPFILIALAVATVGLRYGDRTRATLERVFLGTRKASAGSLADLASRTRRAADVVELSTLLAEGLESALGLEQAALFVREERSGAFTCPGRPLPPLDGSSPIVEAASRRPGPFRPTEGDRGDAPEELTEVDRQWLDSARARLLVPLRDSSGGLIALLAVADKRSERPFEPEDEQLLAAAGAAGALALENLRLRSSQSSRSGGERPAGDPGPAIEVDPEAARLCGRCARLFPPESGSTCPEDETFLEPAPVPALLAAKYRLVRRIGAGGMGVVYLARDVALGRDVAIKTLPSLSAGSSRRLQREARAAALLVHPNLGLIFSSESWRGTPMLVLEYLPGGTLSDRIRRGPVSPARAAAWGAALASALEAIHARSVLHRDVKPSNVGFDAGGTPKLLDFGLVRLLDEADGAPGTAPVPEAWSAHAAGEVSTRTSASHVVGTVPYLSPEALQGRRPTPGFDLWGLALTIYECVTGVNPFAATSNARTVERILTRQAPDPRTLRPDCPGPLAELLLVALARAESNRPASARELREGFEAAGRDLPEEPPDAPAADVAADPHRAPTIGR